MNKGITYNVSSSYPVFDMKSSVFANNNKLTTQIQVNQIPATPTFIIQLPSQLDQNRTNSHLELSPNSSKLPSVSEFFNHLDLKYNCNVYTKFENAFVEEEITVNTIKDLTDEQLQQLDVVKIGWQKNIKQAAQKY